MSVTPVSMAVYMATLANGGTRVTPHLLKAVDDGQRVEAGAAAARRSRRSTIEPEKLQAIRDGLWMVRQRRRAPAAARGSSATTCPARPGRRRSSRTRARSAAGQTDKDLRDNGWFVFFAPRDNPQIAGVVFVEHGDPRRRTPRRVAQHILETFFAKKDGTAAAAAADAGLPISTSRIRTRISTARPAGGQD